MADNQEIAKAADLANIHDLALCHSGHLLAFRRFDIYAIVYGLGLVHRMHIGAEFFDDLAFHRPRQSALKTGKVFSLGLSSGPRLVGKRFFTGSLEHFDNAVHFALFFLELARKFNIGLFFPCYFFEQRCPLFFLGTEKLLFLALFLLERMDLIESAFKLPLFIFDATLLVEYPVNKSAVIVRNALEKALPL